MYVGHFERGKKCWPVGAEIHDISEVMYMYQC